MINSQPTPLGDASRAEPEDVISGKILGERIRERFTQPDFKAPMLPDVAMRLMALTRDPDATIKGFTELLETDPVLTAQVMRIAQSPFYRSCVEISSLRVALVRLGMITVRNIVLAASLNSRIFRNPDFQEAMESLRRHSMATGIAGRLLSQHTGVFEEHAFLGGLMHDIGIAAVLSVISEDPYLVHYSTDEIACVVFEVHEELGGVLLKHWGLPMELELIVANHHHPPPAEFNSCPIATVTLAEALADACGASITGLGDRPFPTTSPEVLEGLRARYGLTDEVWAQQQRELLELLTDLPR